MFNENEAMHARRETEVLKHQLKLVSEALTSCVLASGIVRKDINYMNIAELLMFAEELKNWLLIEQAKRGK
jgi:hypothetical protein